MSNDTGKARLPGLAAPHIDDAALARWVQAVTERLEVREGARGNPYERALTVRDLVGTGLASIGSGGGLSRSSSADGAGGSAGPGLAEDSAQYEALWEELKKSRLYRKLMQRIDDPDRFNDLADEVKAVLLNDIADEARRRKADVQRLDTKIQTDTRSLAMAVQEVTAAVENASAGVRSVAFAQATADTAIAGQITQVVARLDGENIDPANIMAPVYASLDALRAAVPTGVDGKYYQVTNPVTGAPVILYRWAAERGRYVIAGMANSAAVEQVMQATADRVSGLSAEYFVKVQAGGQFGGFGLSAHEKDGVGYSQFLIAADKFAVVNPSGNLNPFLISQVGGAGPYYIYLNGQVRINAGGTGGGGSTVDELADTLQITADRQAFKRNAAGTWDTATLSLTATPTGTLVGRTITWTLVSGTYPGTLPTGNTLTVSRSNFGSDSVTFRASCTSATGAARTDQITVVQLQDGGAGASALTGYLTNEAHTVTADSAGVVPAGMWSTAKGAFKVLLGATDVTASCTFAVSSQAGITGSITAAGAYTASTFSSAADMGTLTLTATHLGATLSKVFTLTRNRNGELTDLLEISTDRQVFKQAADGTWDAAATTLTASLSGTLVGRTVSWTVVSGTYGGSRPNGPTLSVSRASMATATVTLQASVTAPSGVVHLDTMTLALVSDGSAGASALAGYLTNEAHTVGSDASGVVPPGNFTGASGSFKVFRGTSDVTGACTFSVASVSGMGCSINSAGIYTANSFSSGTDTATATLQATYQGAVLIKVFTLTRAREGARGSLTGYSATSGAWMTGTSWAASQSANDHEAGNIIWYLLYRNYSKPYTTYTAHLRIGDTVTLARSDGTKAETRYWSGTNWLQPGVVIDGNLLVTGTVSADKINTLSLTSNAAFINSLTVKAANITGILTASQVEAQAVYADQIREGTNTRHAGYQFGFGAGTSIWGYRGAGYFRSNEYNTYGLSVSNDAGGVALAVNSSGGFAGLFSHGNIDAPKYAATVAGASCGGFFQYRTPSVAPSGDSHSSGAISSALLAVVHAAGEFQRNSITASLCGSDGNYGVETNAAMLAGGYKSRDWVQANGGITSGMVAATRSEMSTYRRGATQGLWTNGGAYIEGSVIIEGHLRIYGVCRASSYLTFTGAHAALVRDADVAALEVGDLCADAQVLLHIDINETITRAERSTNAGQKGVIGVFAGVNSAASTTSLPAGLLRPNNGVDEAALTDEAALLLQTHTLITVNGVGEGQVNVCGRGGNLAVGDLLEASSLPGKAQRQADDLVRASTIGRAREAVSFTDPDNVQLVACIYMCG